MALRTERPSKASKSDPPRRRRREAAVARSDILDAAERRLAVAGPAGIRLQDVAADAGVSHPTVLHHFGSREALVNAVITRALEAIHLRLVAAIEAAAVDGEVPLGAMLDAVFEVLAAGHGRVVMWLALEGHPIGGAGVRLAEVVAAAHALRVAKRGGRGRPPPREDTAHAVVLAALALLGAAVVGPTMLENAGLAHDGAGLARFRAWLAGVLAAHLDGPPAPR